MPSTQALDMKTRLKNTIDGLPALADVERTWSYPKKAPGKRWVSVGEVTWSASDWTTNRSRDESFAIKVVCSVQISGATGQVVETAVLDYMAAIEAAVMAEPQLGNPNVISSSLVPTRLQSFPVSDGIHEAEYEAEFRVTARLA